MASEPARKDSSTDFNPSAKLRKRHCGRSSGVRALTPGLELVSRGGTTHNWTSHEPSVDHFQKKRSPRRPARSRHRLRRLRNRPRRWPGHRTRRRETPGRSRLAGPGRIPGFNARIDLGAHQFRGRARVRSEAQGRAGRVQARLSRREAGDCRLLLIRRSRLMERLVIWRSSSAITLSIAARIV